jgi:hypothetical protein
VESNQKIAQANSYVNGFYGLQGKEAKSREKTKSCESNNIQGGRRITEGGYLHFQFLNEFDS